MEVGCHNVACHTKCNKSQRRHIFQRRSPSRSVYWGGGGLGFSRGVQLCSCCRVSTTYKTRLCEGTNTLKKSVPSIIDMRVRTQRQY